MRAIGIRQNGRIGCMRKNGMERERERERQLKRR
jgi:hypothetical protein